MRHNGLSWGWEKARLLKITFLLFVSERFSMIAQLYFVADIHFLLWQLRQLKDSLAQIFRVSYPSTLQVSLGDRHISAGRTASSQFSPDRLRNSTRETSNYVPNQFWKQAHHAGRPQGCHRDCGRNAGETTLRFSTFTGCAPTPPHQSRSRPWQ